MAPVMNNILVPPKLSNGSVIPVSGIIPIIEATFKATCANNQPTTPATISLIVISGK